MLCIQKKKVSVGCGPDYNRKREKFIYGKEIRERFIAKLKNRKNRRKIKSRNKIQSL